MSLPAHSYDPRRVFRISLPKLPYIKHKRTVGVYLSGILFASAFWVFVDAAVQSAHAKPPPNAPYDEVPVHVTLLDWVPGMLSIIGFVTVNLINKERLTGEGEFGGDSTIIWRARLVLFLGFAMMAGGLAGSVCVLVLKYIIHNYDQRFNYYGYANVTENICLLLSASVLWLAQNAPQNSEYDYQLAI